VYLNYQRELWRKRLGNKGENEKFARNQGNMHSLAWEAINPGMSPRDAWLNIHGLSRPFTSGKRELFFSKQGKKIRHISITLHIPVLRDKSNNFSPCV